jgi:AraC-like DNA-binding protein
MEASARSIIEAPEIFTSRPIPHDPFLDLIRLLRPRATLWGGIDGAGRWGVSFRKRDDLLFCWVERGECQLTRPLLAPVRLRADDFVLVRSTMPFTLTTDPELEPQDSETAVAASGDTGLKLGECVDSPVTLRGGRFVFDTANEELLTGLLPPLVHIAAGDESSWRVRALLEMNETESLRPGPGGGFIIMRLMELILVEILRSAAPRANAEPTGLLAGLADPVTARALAAMHGNVAQDWTVADLAQLCGASRSAFAARFRRIVGTGPIEYLAHWRMALAKDELRLGKLGIGEIALAIGFQSSSAFSTAFTRTVGCSPKRFAASAR